MATQMLLQMYQNYEIENKFSKIGFLLLVTLGPLQPWRPERIPLDACSEKIPVPQLHFRRKRRRQRDCRRLTGALGPTEDHSRDAGPDSWDSQNDD
jgi:hypothetical protein